MLSIVPGAPVALVALVLSLAAGEAVSRPWKPPEPLEDGWSGTIELGGQRLGGNTRSRSVSAASRLTWASGRFESELALELSTSTVTLVTPMRDAAGEIVVDGSGQVILEATRGRSHDRLAGGALARWFWTERVYQFALIEGERDEPAGTDRRRRRVGGVGWKLWKHDEDFLAAELGLGDKRLDYTDGARAHGPIGYAALRFVRRFGERLRLETTADADVAGDDPFAALKIGAGVRVSERVVLKLVHAERHNTRESSPRDPLDSRRDTLTTLSLEVALF